MKDPHHYIFSLIKLQKLISQWIISIKRGFARQVVKYLRGNLSPPETWQAASTRLEGEKRGRGTECCMNGWTWPWKQHVMSVIALAPRQSHNKLSVRQDKSPATPLQDGKKLEVRDR